MLLTLILPPPTPQLVPHSSRCRSFPSSPSRSSLFLPSRKSVLVCDMPRFRAHQSAPLSSSPAGSESSFVTCHVSKLTNPLLPLSPLQEVSPRFAYPLFPAYQPPSPPSSPPTLDS